MPRGRSLPLLVAAAGLVAGMAPPMRLFVSPAGKPFRAGPGEQSIAVWFHEADSNGDGALTLAEFRADFSRYFNELDSDHDGEIGPAEVAHYENDILPEMHGGYGGMGGGMGAGGRSGGGMGGHAHHGGSGGRGRFGGGESASGGGAGDGGGANGGYSEMALGAARYGLLPIPHPIMSADTNLDRAVSRDEFDRAAVERFGRLDVAHTGKLTFDQLVALRTQSFHRRRAHAGRPPAQDDAGPSTDYPGEGRSPPDGARPPPAV